MSDADVTIITGGDEWVALSKEQINLTQKLYFRLIVLIENKSPNLSCPCQVENQRNKIAFTLYPKTPNYRNEAPVLNKYL